MSDDPKTIVRDGYDRASHAYRGDEFTSEGSGYAYWLSRLTPTLAAGSRFASVMSPESATASPPT